MRPEDFSPGNPESAAGPRQESLGFNEAGGFLPRKLIEEAHDLSVSTLLQ